MQSEMLFACFYGESLNTLHQPVDLPMSDKHQLRRRLQIIGVVWIPEIATPNGFKIGIAGTELFAAGNNVSPHK